MKSLILALMVTGSFLSTAAQANQQASLPVALQAHMERSITQVSDRLAMQLNRDIQQSVFRTSEDMESVNFPNQFSIKLTDLLAKNKRVNEKDKVLAD